MRLFDSHCHLNDKGYQKEMDAVVERARQAGVQGIMIVGITGKTSRLAVEIADAYPACYASVGVHPHDASHCDVGTLDTLRGLAARETVKAWGETGLDFNRMFSPREDQERCFARQIELAGETGLPLIFHERDSGGRFHEILAARMKPGQTGVVHCFSGTPEEMKKYLDMGLYIGITGIVTMKKRAAKLRRMIAEMPVNRILVETDAPYLTPEPDKRHAKRNEPAFVRSVLLSVAEARRTDPGELAETVWSNTCRLFGIDNEKQAHPS